MAPNFEQAIQRVFERILAMSEDEFRDRLESHSDGPISRILLETQALESHLFEDDMWWPKTGKLDFESTISFCHELWCTSSPSQAVVMYDPAVALSEGMTSTVGIFSHYATVAWIDDEDALAEIAEADDYQYNIAA